VSKKIPLDEGPFPPLVRVFIAVAIPKPNQELSQQIIAALMNSGAKVSWAKPDALHITLKFLGEIPRDDVPVVRNTLDGVLCNLPNFEIAIEGLGYFPAKGAPRVAWLGIKAGADELARMAAQIDQAVMKLGFAGETRPWQPHITLGRIHSAYRTAELLSLMESTSTAGFELFKADRVIMMRSQLGRGTPIYTNIAVWELQN